jgi:hypothetical protein
MVSSGLLRRVALVRTDVSEERRFLQEPHFVTTQKTPFFIVEIQRSKKPDCSGLSRRRKLPSKRRFTHELRGAIFQKMGIFIKYPARISKPASDIYFETAEDVYFIMQRFRKHNLV